MIPFIPPLFYFNIFYFYVCPTCTVVIFAFNSQLPFREGRKNKSIVLSIYSSYIYHFWRFWFLSLQLEECPLVFLAVQVTGEKFFHLIYLKNVFTLIFPSEICFCWMWNSGLMVLFLEFAFGSFYNFCFSVGSPFLSLRLYFSLSPQATLELVSLDCFSPWLWVIFSYFFTCICLVILDCILDIAMVHCWCKGLCYLPLKSVDFCSSRQFSYWSTLTCVVLLLCLVTAVLWKAQGVFQVVLTRSD